MNEMKMNENYRDISRLLNFAGGKSCNILSGLNFADKKTKSTKSTRYNPHENLSTYGDC